MGWDGAEKWAENEEAQGSRSKPWLCLVPSGHTPTLSLCFLICPKRPILTAFHAGPRQSLVPRGPGDSMGVVLKALC